MIHRSKTQTPLFHNNNTPTKSSTTPISALNTPPVPIPIPQITPNESYIQATYATYSSNNWNENKLLLSISNTIKSPISSITAPITQHTTTFASSHDAIHMDILSICILDNNINNLFIIRCIWWWLLYIINRFIIWCIWWLYIINRFIIWWWNIYIITKWFIMCSIIWLSSSSDDTYECMDILVRAETKLKYNSSIYALPMVRVNEFLIHGNIDCKPPVTQHTCEVLAAICAGFLDGTQPDICYVTPSPTIAHCNDTDKDCASECHGQHIIDACGKCLMVSDPLWNECIGCNGQINETFDCSGECGGHFAVNTCGYCKDIRAADFSTFGVDCKGGCNINLKEDECGECKTESNNTWNHCIGCDGIPYSDFKLNPCGRCIDSTRTDFDIFGEDCANTCDGDAQYDECGQCLLESSTEWNNCIDCEGVPNGPNKMNQCGFCLNTNIYGTDDKFTNYGMDCRGICQGGFTIDECGQCLLPTDNEFNNCCGGNKLKRYNQCGLCLYLNITDFNEKGKDCQGICEGKFIVDACGHCLDPSDSKFDDCMNCGDNNDLKYDCNDVCDGNAKNNPCGMCIDANLPNFDTYGQDCAGECGGKKTKDNCNNCLEPSSTERNSCIGCDNIPNSGQIKNECGVCANPNDVQFNEYGKDCSGNCSRVVSKQHYIDECGKCLMVSDPLWNECVDEQKTNTGNNKQNNGMIMIIVIAAVSFIVVCLALIIIIYLCQKHREMKRTFDQITRTYRPMDDLQTANKTTITARDQETD